MAIKASTGLIVHKDEVLLIFHKKFNIWMAPGGKVEPNELTYETCVREIIEETGLDFSNRHPFIAVELLSRGLVLPTPDEIIAYKNNDGSIEMEDNIYLVRANDGDRENPLDRGEYTGDKIGWFKIRQVVEGEIPNVDEFIVAYLYMLVYHDLCSTKSPPWHSGVGGYLSWRNGD